MNFSFEFFPPRTEKLERNLWHAVQELAPVQPRFVSVTYGAGGSTRERTHATVRRILEETDLTPAAHLTCVDASKEEVNEVAAQYYEMGVRHLVALRGDPPSEDEGFTPRPDGYNNAAELVEGLQEVGDFDISVAGYPETHPEAESSEADIAFLKRKVDAGAKRVITQVFFKNRDFLLFRDRCAAAGIDVPIVPGILPIIDFPKVAKFSRGTGTSVPQWMEELFEGYEDDPTASGMVGAAFATEQCLELRQEGVESFHFYTLNRPDPTRAVCRMMKVLTEGEYAPRSAIASRVA